MEKMVNTSKFISLILRHKPDVIGITLDEHGWANVDELLTGLNKAGHIVCMKDLEDIVSTDNKQRYSFNEDKTLIRANQGHSINVDVELKEVEPPSILYHGTTKDVLESIYKQGIKPMSRLYVHLSKDIDTATKVAKRRRNPIILEVNTEQMRKDNIKFYLSSNGVWLTKYVDSKYIKEMK